MGNLSRRILSAFLSFVLLYSSLSPQTFASDIQPVAGEVSPLSGSEANSAQTPPDDNTEIDIPTIYTVSINYLRDDLTPLQAPYTATVAEGSHFMDEVTSPVIDGYTYDKSVVKIDIENITEHHTYEVIYTANQTYYTVNHHLQNLILTSPEDEFAPENYTLKHTEDIPTQVDSFVSATPGSYEGFSPPATPPSGRVISGEQTILDVYYVRNIYTVYFNTDGGNYIPPVSLRYGEGLPTLATPTKSGHEFIGWDITPPTTMPTEDITLTATWSDGQEVNYSVVYWLQDAESDTYNYVTTVSKTALAGSEVSVSTTPTTAIFNGEIADYVQSISGQSINATVDGDGSTVINIYYDREEITFTFFHPDYTLTVDATTYQSGEYTITARYGAKIIDKWPGSPDVITGKVERGYFFAWRGDLSYTNPVVYMSGSVLTDLDFDALYSSTRPPKSYYIYELPALDHTDENPNYINDYNVVFYTTFSSLSTKEIAGFTRQNEKALRVAVLPGEEELYQDAEYKFVATYTRNNYTIDYFSGGVEVHSEEAVPFETPLSSAYNYLPTRPDNLPEGYTFDGWYTSPSLDGEPFEFGEGQIMPASNLALYAKWSPPAYTVSFDTDGGLPSPENQEVVRLDTALKPADPQKDGYEFLGWYQDGNSLPFTFDRPITEEVSLTAKWRAFDDIFYTVRYVDTQGEDIADSKTVNGNKTLQSVTEIAIEIDGYLPDESAKSLILTTTGNTITFTYTKLMPNTTVGYTVRYLDHEGTPLLPEQSFQSQEAVVLVQYKVISGYYPDYSQRRLVLSSERADNIVEFLYTPLPSVTYSVETYLEQPDGGYALHSTDSNNSMSPGLVATITHPNIPGYTPNIPYSTPGGVVMSDSSTTLKLYYDIAELTVRFYAGLYGSLSGDAEITAHYFNNLSTATNLPTPTPNNGYEFAGWTPPLPTSLQSGGDYTAEWKIAPPDVVITADVVNAVYTGEVAIILTANPSPAHFNYTYRWYKDGILLQDQTASTLSLTEISQSGSYTVKAMASNLQLTSDEVESSPKVVTIGYGQGENEQFFKSYTTTSTTWTNGDNVTFFTADGWTVCATQDGVYLDNITFDEQGHDISKTVYLKNDEGRIFRSTISYRLDNTAPTISSPQGNPTAWQNTSAQITFSVHDDLSGINNILVSHEDGQSVVYTDSTFTADRNGIYSITATDLAGNVSTKTVHVIKIDKTPPTLNLPTFDSEKWYGREEIEVTTSDNASGIATLFVSSYGAYETNITDPRTFIADSPEVGRMSYTVTSTDGAGNVAQDTVTINIDPRINDFLTAMQEVSATSPYSELALAYNFYYNQHAIARQRISLHSTASIALQNLTRWIEDNSAHAVSGFEAAVQSADTIEDILQLELEFNALPEQARLTLSDELLELYTQKVLDATTARNAISQLESAMNTEATYEQKAGAVSFYNALTTPQKSLLNPQHTDNHTAISSDLQAIVEVANAINGAKTPADIAKAEALYNAMSSTLQSLVPPQLQTRLITLIDMAREVEFAVDWINSLPNSYTASDYDNVMMAASFYYALTSEHLALIDTTSTAKFSRLLGQMMADISLTEQRKAQDTLDFMHDFGELMEAPSLQKINTLISDCKSLQNTYGKLPESVVINYEELVEMERAIQLLLSVTDQNLHDSQMALAAYNALMDTQKTVVDAVTNSRAEAISGALNVTALIGAISTSPAGEERQKTVELAKQALETLPNGAWNLISQSDIELLNTEYEEIISQLGYITKVKTSDTEVEVIGTTDTSKVPLPDASVAKTVIELVVVDSTTPHAPTPEGNKDLLLSIDAKLYAKLYTDELSTQPLDTMQVQPCDGQSVLMKILIPQGYDLSSLEIWHIKDDGQRSRIYDFTISTQDGLSYAVFEVYSLSHFVFFASIPTTPHSVSAVAGGGGGGDSTDYHAITALQPLTSSIALPSEQPELALRQNNQPTDRLASFPPSFSLPTHVPNSAHIIQTATQSDISHRYMNILLIVLFVFLVFASGFFFGIIAKRHKKEPKEQATHN